MLSRVKANQCSGVSSTPRMSIDFGNSHKSTLCVSGLAEGKALLRLLYSLGPKIGLVVIQRIALCNTPRTEETEKYAA